MDEVLVVFAPLAIALLIASLVVYKNLVPKILENQIRLKKEEIKRLDEVINSKEQTLSNIDSNDIKIINQKLDDIYHNQRPQESNITGLYFFIIIISAIVMYFLYKWTYYIQPENLQELLNQASNSMLKSIIN